MNSNEEVYRDNQTRVEFLQHKLLQVGFGNALLLPEPGYNVFVKERFVCRETRLLHKPFLVRLPIQGDVAECDYIVLKLVASFR